jgi:DNA (cytosine-5)-methyltransferase 3A
MNVLSLFDGMSCGQQALERAGIKVNQYFASEIDKFAIKVTMANYPKTIQLGSVVNINGCDLPKIDLLIGGSPCQSFSFAGKRKGMATKDEIEIHTLEHYLQLKNDGYEFEGQSYLFWEFMRILNQVKPKYFLLENVIMGIKWERILSNAIGVNPIEINSALVSAQNRRRLYWTNIGMKPAGLFGDLESIIDQPKDKGILLKDVLEIEVDEKYFLSENNIKNLLQYNKNQIDNNRGFSAKFRDTKIVEKMDCIKIGGSGKDDLIVHNTMPRSSTTGKSGTGHLSRNDGKTYCLDTGNTNAVEIVAQRGRGLNNTQQFEPRNDGKTNCLTSVQKDNLVNNTSRIRRLTPIECERLQTVKDNYTAHVSDSQRYKMLGNGWTVDVITHIFKYIK